MFSRMVGMALMRASGSQQVLRTVVLLAFIGAVIAVPIPLSATATTRWVLAGVFVVLLLAIGSGSRFAAQAVQAIHHGEEMLFPGGRTLRPPEQPVALVRSSMLVARRIGLAGPAVLFFLAWTTLFAFLWTLNPQTCAPNPEKICSGAFRGAGHHPSYGEFMYFATNTSLANPPQDFWAAAPVTQSAATVEMLLALGLITLYAGSFFGLTLSGATERNRERDLEKQVVITEPDRHEHGHHEHGRHERGHSEPEQKDERGPGHGRLVGDGLDSDSASSDGESSAENESPNESAQEHASSGVVSKPVADGGSANPSDAASESITPVSPQPEQRKQAASPKRKPPADR